MREILEKLNTLISCTECSNDIFNIEYHTEDYDQMMKRCTLNVIGSENNLFFNATGEFINKMRDLSNIDRGELNFLMNHNIPEYNETEYRRLITKLKALSNLISTEGRIGGATHIVMNPTMVYNINNFVDNLDIPEMNIYNFEYIGKIATMDTFLDSRIDNNEIFIYRKNNYDQPGLSLFWTPFNDEIKYTIAEIGFFPQNQYIRLNITNNV